jgi:hypothetical protein
MEWWILSGLAVAALAVGGLTRLRRRLDRSRLRRARASAPNIYPLW